MNSSTNAVTADLVPEGLRMDVADAHFGLRYVLQVEPLIWKFAAALSEDYDSGYWHFHTLSNGGFYMAPDLDCTVRVESDNGYQGTMSADALGITACLYAFSQLSFGGGKFGVTCSRHYHRLREFALGHCEAAEILAAID